MLAHMSRISLLLFSTLLFNLLACGGSSAPEAAAAETTSGSELALVPPGETSVGDRSTCPVSGHEFVVTEDSPTFEHEGRTYHFCCSGCVDRFAADPERYLEAAPEGDHVED